MEALKLLLSQVDDDYLIGLSNKGIVKRAYKDLEQEHPELSIQEVLGGEPEVRVTLKDAECIIRAPLGESSCSCPSRSTCRHLVTAILWMRRELSAGSKSAEDEVSTTEETGETTAQPRELTEALNVSREKLKKICGNRRLQRLISMAKAGELPTMEESSIVTMSLSWEPATVKLLEPLVHSTCSCHSKELCVHKAQAILIYQLKKGVMGTKNLETMLEGDDSDLIPEDVNQACQAVKEAVQLQICTGLSRQSPEVTDQMERLAVMAHRGGLASLEGKLRQVETEYERYFERSSAFSDGWLLQKLLEIRRLALRMEEAMDSARGGSQTEARRLAGTFRDDYLPAGTLELIGVGSRRFSGAGGYEGETYYFLEENQKQWYTWTDARPTFYEGSYRRPGGNENAQAPWGLNCAREDLLGMQLELKNARVASGNRLSASKESQAEIRDIRGLETEAFQSMIHVDYEELLTEYEQWEQDGNGQRYLVLLQASGWETPSFDKVNQRFSWNLKDRKGRRIAIALQYSPAERVAINMMERLEKKLSEGQWNTIIFLGSLYIKDGRLCLYPIEYYLRASAKAEGFLKKTGLGRREEAAAKPQKDPAVDREILDAVGDLVKEGRRQLTDLLVSGLASVPQGAADRLERLAVNMEESGLSGGAEELDFIGKALNRKRHQMEFDPVPVIEAMDRGIRYLDACERKLDHDRARAEMQ